MTHYQTISDSFVTCFSTPRIVFSLLLLVALAAVLAGLVVGFHNLAVGREAQESTHEGCFSGRLDPLHLRRFHDPHRDHPRGNLLLVARTESKGERGMEKQLHMLHSHIRTP